MHSTRLRKHLKALTKAKADYAAAGDDTSLIAEIAARFFAADSGFLDDIDSITAAAEANDKRVQHNDEGRVAVATALRGMGYAVDSEKSLQEIAQAVSLQKRREGRRTRAGAEESTRAGPIDDGLGALAPVLPAPKADTSGRGVVDPAKPADDDDVKEE